MAQVYKTRREREEELESFLLKVKEESVQKTYF